MDRIILSTSWLFWNKGLKSDLNIIERITKLQNEENNGNIVLPKEFIMENIIPGIIVTFVTLCVFYNSCFYFIHLLLPNQGGGGGETTTTTTMNEQEKEKENKKKKSIYKMKQKASYQLTNLCMNFILGCTGLYFEYAFIQPMTTSTLEVERTISGLEYTAGRITLLSCMQLGYQFWALPMGLFYVKEGLPMLIHHVAVIFPSIMTGCFACGFRYFSPFLYGIIEISSVPLALVNTMKDNPQWLKQYPMEYNLLRLVFAVTFLGIRVYMCVPRMIIFTYHAFLVGYTSSMTWHQYYMYLVAALASFLTFLQLYWGNLIFKSLVKNIVPLLVPSMSSTVTKKKIKSN